MTEKVKIPQNIADAIERLRNADYSDYGIILHVGSEGPSSINGVPTERRVLGNWTYDNDGENADKLLDALRIGYEIELEPLEVGDWAKITHELAGTYIGKILEIKTDHNGVEVARAFWNYQYSASLLPLKSVVKCTPEEIETMKEGRLWSHQAQRKVKDFREGDIVINSHGVPFIIGDGNYAPEGVIAIYTAENWYNSGMIKGFYRTESFINFEEVEPNATTHN